MFNRPFRGISRVLKHQIILMVFLFAGAGVNRSESLPDFDFTQRTEALQWGEPHDSKILAPTPEGLPLSITGEDPYLFGPLRDYPEGQRLWAQIRIKSDQGGKAQLFYFTTGATEEKSVHFPVKAGSWTEVRVPVPALGGNTRLRLDPPGNSGTCTLGRISFEARPTISEPVWVKPVIPVVTPEALRITSGELSLVHGAHLGAFEVKVRGRTIATGNTRSMVGYLSGTNSQWLTLTNRSTVQRSGGGIQVQTEAVDSGGAHWSFAQVFTRATISNGVDVVSRVTVDQDRSVIFLPLLTLLPGFGSFGTNKSQALFAGVEYLENEPSSSEADVTGAGSRRQVPDSMKVTFPLMVLAAEGNYVGLIWEKNAQIAALHDSPDRLFNSGGHLMSLIFPGSNPSMREDGSVLPYGGEKLFARQSLILRATIIGGVGTTVVPAVQQYLARRPLAPVQQTGYSASDYFALEAHGWLDSDIRDGAKFRHAVGSNFQSAPAADAALYTDWLATKITDTELKTNLAKLSQDALALVPSAHYNASGIAHIRFPAESLVFGAVAENAAWSLAQGRGQLNAFKSDGAISYQPPASGNDLSRTHWSKEANGLTATHIAAVLEAAAFSGDKLLINDGIRLLRSLSKFRDSVPRGAQTWEVPLHTPDILASAYLVRAYTLGYELTGEPELLEEARYWAWTGVPFVYLAAPSAQPVGLYATTPVFGATQFVAPNWIGLPVQWCGLVYGNAVRRFARHDPSGPWVRLANGIAASGVQQTHPASEPHYQGLLPDSFDLASQMRNPVPINPGTLLPEAIQMFGEDPPYDFYAFRRNGLLVHAPGPIRDARESKDSVKFSVRSWSTKPWYVLINGCGKKPSVLVNDLKINLETPHQFQEKEGRLILQLDRPSTIEIRDAN
ncbi:MAG: hypothetical protein JWM99_5138 [Verrucomicrobiales bacterium]|nr:hypothetical protein [Verrucomicrobiales bacterium]